MAITNSTECPVPILDYTDEVEMQDTCGVTKVKRRSATYPNEANPWLYAECVQIIMLQNPDDPIISNCPYNCKRSTTRGSIPSYIVCVP
jgi:hypothetical protein